MTPTGISVGANMGGRECRREQEEAEPRRRGRNKNTMVGAGHQSNRVRNDQVNEPIGR